MALVKHLFPLSLRFACGSRHIDNDHWIADKRRRQPHFGHDKLVWPPQICQILRHFFSVPNSFMNVPSGYPFFFAMTHSLISRFHARVYQLIYSIIRAFRWLIKESAATCCGTFSCTFDMTLLSTILLLLILRSPAGVKTQPCPHK